MARQESDREDLIAEATALVPRLELRARSFSQCVTMGFRRSGAGCVYLGAAPVYQFNSQGELRRAFQDGKLYKAERGRLVEIRRVRLERQVQLRTLPLPDDRQAAFLREMVRYLDQLQADWTAGQIELLRQVPEESSVALRFQAWLAGLPRPPVVAQRPHAGG